MKIIRFEELKCWQETKILVRLVYQAIQKSAKIKSDFGLRDRLTRAAVFVMSNIAEGFSRQTNKEFVQFLPISKSSAPEIQSLLYVAHDLGYIEKQIFQETYDVADKVSQLNSGFIKYLSSQHK
ncbi:MAG: four helix bundle protein [Candidatus Omnitrophica bacterium]|nr:four helix bundle protein [Candidatus Omnitrophota bacterium]MDD5574936.1 four helix bundle protein [Candidatus Omnitrophota bacterium]